MGIAVALMRPADALAFPCGKRYEETGGRVRPPVSSVLAMFSELVLESACVGAAPVSVSLSKGEPLLPLRNCLLHHVQYDSELLLGQPL